MAYDQGYYQPPSRPYNGRAAAPPSQAYNQPAPPQQYGGQGQGQFDQYGQDDGYGYGADGYNNGYDQQQDYGYQQPPMNGGGRGGAGRGPPPPQNNGYGPPEGEYYGNGGGRGGPDPRGGGGGGRGRAGDPYGGRPAQGPPGGNHNGRSGGPPRGSGRPGPPNRANSSDPGSQRRPPPQQPMSPQETSWDNPFPGFPGAKKKTSISEEQQIVQGMANMDVNGARPRTAGGTRGPDPSRRPPPGPDNYGGSPGEGQRRGPPGGGYPPQGPGNAGQRPPPGRAPPPRQNTYTNGNSGYNQAMPPANDGFGPPSRSMTMPNDVHSPGAGQNPSSRYPVGDVGPSAPYNGPVGKTPPRPATAGGGRAPPQRTYPQEPPPQQGYGNEDFPSAGSGQKHNSITDLYDDYFQDDNQGQQPGRHSLDNMHQGSRRDNGPMPPRQQVNGNQPMNGMQSKPDFRAQIQPQSAVYEMAGDAPATPNEYDQGGPQQGYNQPYGQYNQRPQNGYGQDYNQGGPQGYGQGRGPPPQGRGPPGGPGQYNNNGMPPRSNSLPKQQPPPQQGLPSHPPPVRAGLMPGSVANLASNKPPPVRNYGNAGGPPPPNQQQQQQQQPPQQRQSLNQNQPAAPPPVTHDEIERLRVIVRSQPNDTQAGLTLARKLIEASEVLAPQIPDQRARAKARERYVMDGHKILKRLCAGPQPYPEAQFFLADCLGRGALGLEPDNKEAFMLYQSAAKAGHAAAAYRTAVCCELGSDDGGGTRKDPLKAIQWYKRAATLGDTPAMYKMGMILLKGLLGQPKNPREAVGWLKRAADQADAENPHALHELGLLYEGQQAPDGSGTIIRDEAYALSLFTQSAELGYKFSQFRLGCAYEYGLMGCPISPRDSIQWYSRAAVQEEHQSELALSGWYLTGSEGVLGQSDTEAYLWARKAALAGLAKAEYAMGYFTEVGIGSPSDLEGAKRWYWRAAAQNFPKARERLEDLKRGGAKPQLKSRERISRSKVGKQNEGECIVM